jgi:O-antigen ligase
VLLSDSYDRLAGMLVNPNAYGGLLTVACGFLLFGSGEARSPLSRVLRVGCLLSLTIGLVLTSSRSSWVGFLLLSAFACLKRPWMLVAMVALAAASLAGVYALAGPDYFDQLLTLSERQDTLDERIVLGRMGLQMFEDHPLFGAGIGTFIEEADPTGFHNTALWFLAEFGLVGLVVFVGFAAWFVVKGVAAYRRAGAGERPVVAGLLGGHLAMIGISMGNEALYQRHWWLVMALIALAYMAARRHRAAAPSPGGGA